MQLFLIGSSGTGKDTQAKLLSQHFNLRWMSVGNILRERAAVLDSEGSYIKEKIDNGELLDWEHLQPIINNQLMQQRCNFIWTGFPRVLEQARYFDELVKESQCKLDLVINLVLHEDIIKQRIEYRKNNDIDMRKDDSDTLRVHKRIEWYNKNISAIKEYYIVSNRYVDVDASLRIPEVFERIKSIIKDHKSNS